METQLAVEPATGQAPALEEQTMEAPTLEEVACEITRLPEEILLVVLSRTSPRDVCRATAVSPTFRAAVNSDAAWPSDLPPLADGELPPSPLCFKERFLFLSDHPILLADRLRTMWLDRETGARCYMLSARDLYIASADKRENWSWVPLAGSRFSENAILNQVRLLEISGKIHSKMLSQDSPYAAYMVFKMANDFYGLDSPVQEASVSIGGTKSSTRKVCLQVFEGQQRNMRRVRYSVTPGKDVTLPTKRCDGWRELELGEFFCEGHEDHEVSFTLTEIKELNWKSGLIVQGIEIRCKKSG